MRAREFLIEYKRDITAQRLGTKLIRSGEREGITNVDKILAALESMDPTTNKQYTVWLANQYISEKFRLEDQTRILNVIKGFETIKSRLPEKDIGKYDLHSLEDTIDRAMGSELGSKAALSSGTFPVVPDSEVLYNGPLGQLSIPKTKKASCELGTGTKWCTAAKSDSDNLFTHYADQGPLYIWRDKDGSKYQFHFPSTQFMDSRDRRISTETIKYFRTQHPVLKKLFAMGEKEIAKDPELAHSYALNIIKGRWPEGEAAIAKDPRWSYEYARHVIRGRFPEGEAAIAKSPAFSYEYARYVIKGRFPEGEAAIAKSSAFSYEYARYVIKGRWPEGEAAIAKDPYLSYEYARYVIKGRFSKGEAATAKDPRGAYDYAREVIKGRWPEAEAAIAKDPELAHSYALYVIKGRWPEAEAAIAKDPYSSYSYAREVIKGRWPEVEAAIAKVPYSAYAYARYVIRGRFPEAEAAIAKDPRWAYEYARYVIKGRFPEAEPRLRRSDFWNSYMVAMKTLGTPV